MQSAARSAVKVRIRLVEIGVVAHLPCLVSSPAKRWRADEAKGTYGENY